MRGIARPLLCLGLVVSALPAHAAVPSARVVIERYVEATGGRAALEADTVLHLVGHATDAGMHGTFEIWMQGPDRALRVDRMGLLRTKQGLNGTIAWSTDFTSKKIDPVEGKDLEAMRA